MLVELKNGETLNGLLVTCDTWMNLTLKEVVQTSAVCHPPHTIQDGAKEFEFGVVQCARLIDIGIPRKEINSQGYRRFMSRETM